MRLSSCVKSLNDGLVSGLLCQQFSIIWYLEKQYFINILAGADGLEHASALHSCHGVFIDRFIFRSNFRGMRLPWEYHDQSQESNLTSLRHWTGTTFLSQKKSCTKNKCRDIGLVV